MSTTDTSRQAIEPVRGLVDQLENQLLPHEHAAEAQLLPIVAKAMRGADPTCALSRTHG